MRVVLQRVKQAVVRVDGAVVGAIGTGLLVFLGIAKGDGEKEADYLVEKVVALRIFEDRDGKMNINVEEAGGEVLVVSQFTLYGDCRKGRRPSFDRASPPVEANGLYEYFVQRMRLAGVSVKTGVFQAAMEVELLNDGPVTMLLDSEKVI